MALPLLSALLVAGHASAHGDTSGLLRAEMDAMESGTSDGYYQYQLFWGAFGDGHESFTRTRLESARTSLGPWTTWQTVYDHYGLVFPAPLGVWHRANICHRFSCLYVLKSNAVWLPRRLCSSGGGRQVR